MFWPVTFPRVVRLGIVYLRSQHAGIAFGRDLPKKITGTTVTVHDDGGPDRGPLADRTVRFRIYGTGTLDAAEDDAEAIAASLRIWPLNDSHIASVGAVRGPWVVSDVDAPPELLITADVTLIGATS